MKRIIGLLVLAALLIKFWPWILAAVLLWWVIKADLQVLEESRTERAARAAVDGWSGVLGL